MLLRFVLNLGVPHYSDIEGFLSPLEAAMLYSFASRLSRDGLIVEIGSWKGRSTYCLARGLRSGRIVAIDPFDASGDADSVATYGNNSGRLPLRCQFAKNMYRSGVLHKIELKHGCSNMFVGTVSDIDFLFIDGDHSIDGAKFDYMNYACHLEFGGYLAFHDYYASRKELGPTWVVDNMVARSGQYRFVGLFDSLWIGQRI